MNSTLTKNCLDTSQLSPTESPPAWHTCEVRYITIFSHRAVASIGAPVAAKPRNVYNVRSIEADIGAHHAYIRLCPN